MSSVSSEKDQGVDIVKREDDAPQESPTGGQPQDTTIGAEAPSHFLTETATSNVAAGQKKEDIGVAAGEKKDAPPPPQGQPTGAGDPQPPVVGEATTKMAAETPIVNSSQAKAHHATDTITSSKDNHPRQSLPSDGLLQMAPSSASLEDGKLVEIRKPQATETNFPMKLYDMLSNPDNAHAIAWMPHGRAWKVRQKDVFMRTICPQYFSQTKFESFIRQANGWGFRRIRKEGPDRNAYYHDLFLRGKPELLEDMRRPLPGEKASQEVKDPDFYNLPALPQMPHGYDQSSSKQISFASPSSNEGKRKKKRKTDSNRVGSSPESAFSNPYGGQGPDPHWYGMPPPSPSQWGVPYPYSQNQGYGMPPPMPPQPESGAAWPQQPSPSHQEQGMPGGTNMPPPQSDMPPFDPSYYFPPYYSPYPPPPSQMNQSPSQYQATPGSNNDESNMIPTPDGLIMPPPPPQYQYQPYPPPPPQYPGNMPYYPPPGDMPYNPPPPPEAGPPSGNPDSSSGPYHYGYQFGPPPPPNPNFVPTNPNPLPQGGQGGGNVMREEDSFQFSPIQHQDES